jgi:hypothetical protein
MKRSLHDCLAFGLPCSLVCFGEAVEPAEYGYARDAGRLEYANQPCFQQSTGDSTRPEVDVPKGALMKLRLECGGDATVRPLDFVAEGRDVKIHWARHSHG